MVACCYKFVEAAHLVPFVPVATYARLVAVPAKLTKLQRTAACTYMMQTSMAEMLY